MLPLINKLLLTKPFVLDAGLEANTMTSLIPKWWIIMYASISMCKYVQEWYVDNFKTLPRKWFWKYRKCWSKWLKWPKCTMEQLLLNHFRSLLPEFASFHRPRVRPKNCLQSYISDMIKRSGSGSNTYRNHSFGFDLWITIWFT